MEKVDDRLVTTKVLLWPVSGGNVFVDIAVPSCTVIVSGRRAGRVQD